MRPRGAAAIGSILAAMASSACCWLPLVLMGIGLSAAGVGAFFEQYRPFFLAVALLLLGIGFYFNYFRKERCAPGEACEIPNPKFRRFNRGMLWLSMLLVAAFALFPSYVGKLFGSMDAPSEIAATSTSEWKIEIQGMTCSGCEITLETALSDVPGVKMVGASFESGSAILLVDAGSPPDSSVVVEAVRRVGYKIHFTDPSP